MSNKEKETSLITEVKNVKKKVIKYAILVLIIGLIAVGISLSISHFSSESKTTKIGFENIGELNTQVAYCTVVDVIDDPRKIFKITVPFTKTKCVYSYDVIVKAGLDFGKISWEAGESKIEVKMPAVRITDSYIDEKSGKVYHEEESLFSNITIEEHMTAREKLVERGVQDAIDNGLYDNAKTNAEAIMTSFFKQHEEYKDMEIEYKWEKIKEEGKKNE